MATVGDAKDHSGTNARAALVAALSAAVSSLASTGDLAGARIAADALVRLLAAREGDGGREGSR